MNYISLHLSTNSNQTTLKNGYNSTIHNIRLIWSNVVTNSLTNKAYFVNIPELLDSYIISNVSNKIGLPLIVGNQNYQQNIIIARQKNMTNNINYYIYDTSGNLTSDTVSIDLFFSFE